MAIHFDELEFVFFLNVQVHGAEASLGNIALVEKDMSALVVFDAPWEKMKQKGVEVCGKCVGALELMNSSAGVF